MKTTGIIIGCTALVIGIVAVEESRISKLEARIEALEAEEAPAGADTIGNEEPKLVRKKNESSKAEPEPEMAESATKSGESGFEDAIRKIYENKAGLAMVREESRIRANSIYARLIDEFELSPEEAKHFINLIAPSVGEQDRVGMELFNAKSGEESLAIIEKMEKDQAERLEAVREFLNHEEDFETFEDYHARQSEYEQLPALTSLMQDIGTPLSSEQESQLVEAMYAARTETGMTERWEGREGFYQFGEPGVSGRFEKDWDAMQSDLNGRVGDFLEPSQHDALKDHQQQIENFIMMGMRMAEGMIESKRQGGE
ncbi:MAG: hypothetical protein AAGI48_18095 [Verrucomicrobiota bacterium]